MFKRLNSRRQPPAVKSQRAEPIVQVPKPLMKRKNAFLIEEENSCKLAKSSEPVAKFQSSIKTYFKRVHLLGSESKLSSGVDDDPYLR